MGISCQRNGHWPATDHLSDSGLVQPLSSAAGRCAGRGCALIRQLANKSNAEEARDHLSKIDGLCAESHHCTSK